MMLLNILYFLYIAQEALKILLLLCLIVILVQYIRKHSDKEWEYVDDEESNK